MKKLNIRNKKKSEMNYYIKNIKKTLKVISFKRNQKLRRIIRIIIIINFVIFIIIIEFSNEQSAVSSKSGI